MDQPVQRVCPHCARISFESGSRCPYCGGAFHRGGLLALAALLAVFAVVILGGVGLMLVAAGDELDSRLDREVDRVQRQFETDFGTIRDEVREELDRRLPSPTATP